MKRFIIFILMVFTFQLYSLEIRVNGSLYESYTAEGLNRLSYSLPGTDAQGIYLYELLPLMKQINSFRFISSDFIMETDMNESLYISIKEDNLTLHSDSFGIITLPEVIEIEGIPSKIDKLTVWLDKEHQSLIREIDLLAGLHKIEIQYRIEKNLISLLEYNMFNDTQIPDLIIYDSEKLNRLYPLLREIHFKKPYSYGDSSAFTVNNKLLALPCQISRPILLKGSSGGENHFFTSDFGDMDLLYPLLIRFGMGPELDLNTDALKDSLYYLTGLYTQGIFKLSDDPEKGFIDGRIDSIYASSPILGKIKGDIKKDENRLFPQLGGENPPPLLNYTFLSIPGSSRNPGYSKLLLTYLTDFGVQQRIDPRSGYLPYNRETYNLLIGSEAKEMLLEDLDKALWLPPGETMDKLRFVMPKLLRLIVTGRLTIEEGIAEIFNYMEKNES